MVKNYINRLYLSSRRRNICDVTRRDANDNVMLSHVWKNINISDIMRRDRYIIARQNKQKLCNPQVLVCVVIGDVFSSMCICDKHFFTH